MVNRTSSTVVDRALIKKCFIKKKTLIILLTKILAMTNNNIRLILKD
jgi:hypothetical protein